MRIQTGTNWPLIYHGNGPGKTTDIWKEVIDKFHQEEPWQERKPKIEGITVITWSIPEETTLLEESFAKMGIKDELIVIPLSRPINWLDKIKKTKEYLDKIDTKYIIGIDATDVIISTDEEGQKTLWYDIKETFKKTNCKLLFNAEKYNWPSSAGRGTSITEIDGIHGELLAKLIKVEKLEEDIYKDFANSPFYRMNSGGFVGYTDFTRKFYNTLWDKYVEKVYNKGEDEGFFGGDQGFIRIMQDDLFPDVRIDCHCEIFQTFAGLERSDITDIRGGVK